MPPFHPPLHDAVAPAVITRQLFACMAEIVQYFPAQAAGISITVGTGESTELRDGFPITLLRDGFPLREGSLADIIECRRCNPLETTSHY